MAIDPGHGPYKPRRHTGVTVYPPSKFVLQSSKELYHRATALFSQLEELIDFNPDIVKTGTPKEWKASLRDLKDQLDLTGTRP